MIAQLTHLMPRPDCFDKVVELLEEWGLVSFSDRSSDVIPLSFVSRDGEHLFVVSMYNSEEEYKNAVADNRQWTEKLMPLLVEHHGPTYYGEVLGMGGGELENCGIPLPSGIFIGDRL